MINFIVKKTLNTEKFLPEVSKN